MSDKLGQAFRLTTEEHSGAFERFANAFLVDDYPELNALGSKKDGGMDAYIFNHQDGSIPLVVQSCISPVGTARTKVLNTIKKLAQNPPKVLIYCTTAPIGTALDETKKELRTKHQVTLDVCDSAWFIQREKTSKNRVLLSETYSNELLAPILATLRPDHLYSQVLTDAEERIGLQYLEASNLDRAKGGNLTKGIFDALIVYVTRDSNPPQVAYPEEAIITAICNMFPDSHALRIREIVSGRIRHLVSKVMIHYNTAAAGYVLAFEQRERIQTNIATAQSREIAFLAALKNAVDIAAEQQEIDYEFKSEEVAKLGHHCVLWLMSAQGKGVASKTDNAPNILNSEKLVNLYLASFPLPNGATLDAVKDLLPQAIYTTLNTQDTEISHYLRAKADLFIIHSLLQATPDVQEACKKMLGGDILYLDTTILIRCIAESFSADNRKPVLKALECARTLGYRLKTWTPYIEELVSHLRGPVLLEWNNHYQGEATDKIEHMLRTAPTLLSVFYQKTQQNGSGVQKIIDGITGKTNHLENTAEYLQHEFIIETQELPPAPNTDADKEERNRVLTAWRDGKLRHNHMPDDRFEQLIQNDVNSYLSIINIRRSKTKSGPNQGQKIWYLTLDRMPWRIAKTISSDRDAMYEIAMSLSYLINCVATLANAGLATIPGDLIPATAILDETEMVPNELRAIYNAEWDPNEKKYLRERRLRDQIHQLKSSEGEGLEPLSPSTKILVLADEAI